MSYNDIADYHATIKVLRERVEELELRNGRLRKAVNWLRGANHDAEYEPRWRPDAHHKGTVDECDVWECQRARDILEENRV